MGAQRHDRRGRGRLAASAAGLLAALALGACQTDSRHGTLFGGGGSPEITGSVGPTDAAVTETRKLAKRWEKNPGDARLAVAYAAQLTALGSTEQALGVLEQSYMAKPNDPQLAAAYGRQLASQGRLDKAADVLGKALTLNPSDWRLYSALGTVLDRQGENAKAQDYYRQGLKLKPNHTPILNNLGMSQALGGNLKGAEKTLREAMAIDGSNTTIRQNLALVVGLQGRFEEAEQIVSRDLPPNLVAANIAYLRTMLSQNNVWDSIKSGRKAGEPKTKG